MIYRTDEDLGFLGRCTAPDLHPLFRFLTKDREDATRLMEALRGSESYKEYYPSHDYYWRLLGAELQMLGAESIGTMSRGGEGVLYRELLADVCDKMKVHCDRGSSVEVVELQLLLKLLVDSLRQMDDAARRVLRDGFELPGMGLTGPAIAAGLQAAVRAGGFATYQLAVIVANAVTKTLLGRGLPFLVKAALKRAIEMAVGPVGGVVTGLWTLASLAEPAYRVSIPAIVQVAYLRIKEAQGVGTPSRPGEMSDHDW